MGSGQLIGSNPWIIWLLIVWQTGFQSGGEAFEMGVEGCLGCKVVIFRCVGIEVVEFVFGAGSDVLEVAESD